MKRIITHGDKTRPKPIRQFLCPVCHCIFIATHNDYKYEVIRNEDIWSSTCPECGKTAYSYQGDGVGS